MELPISNRMTWKVFISLLMFFVHSGAASFTSQDFKTGFRYELPLSKRAFSPLRSEKDGQITHRESRSYSNFDREDRNEDRGQNSFPSTSEEPPELPRLFENFPMKRPNFDTEKAMSDVEDSTTEPAVLSAPPLIIPWLGFSGPSENFENLGYLDSRKSKDSQWPKKFASWTKQEPLYIEEPNWQLIDLITQNPRERLINRDDYFYTARGKKMETGTKINAESAKNTKDVTKKKSIIKKSESLRKYLLENAAAIITSGFEEKYRQYGYVQPSNKRGDIFDILTEPFVISRGKKDSVKIERSNNNEDGSKIHFKITTEMHDRWLPKEEMSKDYDQNSFESFQRNARTGEQNSRFSSTESLHDQREMERLLKDPFYATRGK